MRIHYVQHVPFEGLGYIESWANIKGCVLSSTKMYQNVTCPSLDDFDWLIVMGGPMSVHDTDACSWLIDEKDFIRRTIESGKPVLGICLGAQIIADVLGAKVSPGREKEVGWFPVEKLDGFTESFGNIFPDKVDVFHWHGETFDIPQGSIPVASSAICKNQGFVYHDKIIGLQFHLEATVESVQGLIDNCSDEIVEAPYIQTADQMLEDRGRFLTINRIMHEILNHQQRFV